MVYYYVKETTDLGCIMDIVDKLFRFFAEKQNPENLADMLLLAMKKSEAGITAWREASALYSEKQFVERLENLFLKNR